MIVYKYLSMRSKAFLRKSRWFSCASTGIWKRRPNTGIGRCLGWRRAAFDVYRTTVRCLAHAHQLPPQENSTMELGFDLRHYFEFHWWRHFLRVIRHSSNLDATLFNLLSYTHLLYLLFLVSFVFKYRKMNYILCNKGYN